MQATGTLEIRVLRYSFGIIYWYREEMEQLDTETKTVLIIYGHYHPEKSLIVKMFPEKREEEGWCK
jgi:hypothetical protein